MNLLDYLHHWIRFCKRKMVKEFPGFSVRFSEDFRISIFTVVGGVTSKKERGKWAAIIAAIILILKCQSLLDINTRSKPRLKRG
jgi:hypothetical protein